MDPYHVMGVTTNATESELRARYLELVKAFPPERDPEKFREIRAAYEAVNDPLILAMKLIEPPDEEDAPDWSDVLSAQAERPPRLYPVFLMSLGNREVSAIANPKPEETT